MAEVWYLNVDTESLEGVEPTQVLELGRCIELLDLNPDSWDAELDALPVLKTGDPFIDESGYVYIFMRLNREEADTYVDKRWKPGWYRSRLTIVGFETNLRKKPK
jgi:hypothetical protein